MDFGKGRLIHINFLDLEGDLKQVLILEHHHTYLVLDMSNSLLPIPGSIDHY